MKDKGITLIALVITIIVLLILAGVSIAMLTGQNGILNQANEAKTENIIEKEREEIRVAYNGAKIVKKGQEVTSDELNNQFSINKTKATASGANPIKVTFSETGNEYTIDSNGIISDPNNTGGGQTGGQVQPGGTSSKTEKDNYTDETGKKATIPEGFKVSDINGEKNIDTGLVVIAPDGSEFVWIPVETVVSDTEENGTTNKAMAIQDTDGVNYKGLLYDFTSSGSTVRSGCTTNISSIREPDIVSSYDNDTTYLGIINTTLGTSLSNSENFKTHLQAEYKNMIESVKKYSGFYVGRYETSLNGDTVQSKKNVQSATADTNSANSWYGLYAKQKTYNTNSVQGQMIWGSQYDAMMHWMQKKSIDVISTTPIAGASKNTGRITGRVEKDKLNNIYDILGNSYEWSAESFNTNSRVSRRRYSHL